MFPSWRGRRPPPRVAAPPRIVLRPFASGAGTGLGAVHWPPRFAVYFDDNDRSHGSPIVLAFIRSSENNLSLQLLVDGIGRRGSMVISSLAERRGLLIWLLCSAAWLPA